MLKLQKFRIRDNYCTKLL